jgi:hypothetical protein
MRKLRNKKTGAYLPLEPKRLIQLKRVEAVKPTAEPYTMGLQKRSGTNLLGLKFSGVRLIVQQGDGSLGECGAVSGGAGPLQPTA